MLTEELMRKVRQVQIRTRRTVNEDFAGEYSSAFKGRGMEFAEVRLYQPGDDVRTIDWNVTARTGEPHVKSYVEERELTVVLAVDLSASGAFGTTSRFKNETAAELCAVLAFTAIRNNDKVGLVVFTEDIEQFIPPKKGTRHVLRIIREVLDFAPRRRGTDVGLAVEHLARRLRKRAVVFLVSDFLPGSADEAAGRDAVDDVEEPLSACEMPLRLLARRHDVIAASVVDPRETELPAAGLLEIADAETGRRRFVDTSSAVLRRRYEARTRRRRDRLREGFRRLGVDHVEIRTDRSWTHDLVELFRRRERRRLRRP